MTACIHRLGWGGADDHLLPEGWLDGEVEEMPDQPASARDWLDEEVELRKNGSKLRKKFLIV